MTPPELPPPGPASQPPPPPPSGFAQHMPGAPPMAPPRGPSLIRRMPMLWRIAQIASLALATLLPGMLVESLVGEREARQASVREEITRSWGPAQTVDGPVLVVPLRSNSDRTRRYLKIAPTRLTSAAELQPETRRRGIFDATVYAARLRMSGSFAIPNAEALRTMLRGDGMEVLWDEAVVKLGLSGLAGLSDEARVTLGGRDTAWAVCPECRRVGVLIASVPQAPAPGTELPLTAELSFRGATSLYLATGAADRRVTMAAPWPSPSFAGSALPVSSSVTAEGFTAEWREATLGRGRAWVTASLEEPDPTAQSLGVDLIQAVPTYRMISRAAKYDLLIVVLTFTVYMAFETLSGLRIHLVQYGLLAASVCLFPLLLLAIGEPLGFGAGYAISAGLILVQASVYTAAVARRVRPALLFGGLLAGLFGFLYGLLGLESYSLLLGSVALFVLLSGLMALVQRIAGTSEGPDREGVGPGGSRPDGFRPDGFGPPARA